MNSKLLTMLCATIGLAAMPLAVTAASANAEARPNLILIVGDVQQTAYGHERTCNYITNNGTTDWTDFFCSCPPQGRAIDGCGPNGPNPELKDPVHAETEFVPAKTRSFLDARDGKKPFCLSLSLKALHAPFQGFAPRSILKRLERIRTYGKHLPIL